MASFITEILVHIVRNAVDHGIEMPERDVLQARMKRNITVSAKRRKVSLVVTVSDDVVSQVDDVRTARELNSMSQRALISSVSYDSGIQYAGEGN
jgi:signal transduction histidine kinase